MTRFAQAEVDTVDDELVFWVMCRTCGSEGIPFTMEADSEQDALAKASVHNAEVHGA
jgi:hypothetical protein